VHHSTDVSFSQIENQIENKSPIHPTMPQPNLLQPATKEKPKLSLDRVRVGCQYWLINQRLENVSFNGQHVLT
jgi:hypothetical protein